MTAILLLAVLLQAPDFDLNGNGDALNFTLNGSDVPPVLRPKLSEPTRLPIVLGYVTEHCRYCDDLKRDAVRLNSPRIELKDPPDWTAGHGFPVIHWETPSGWKSQDGWPGLAKFLDTYDKSMKPAPTAAIAPPGRVVISNRHGLYYGSYPSTYDWPGDLRQHLTQSPHNYSREYVNSLSDQQVIALHDSWHIQHAAQSPAVRERRGLLRLFGGR